MNAPGDDELCDLTAGPVEGAQVVEKTELPEVEPVAFEPQTVTIGTGAKRESERALFIQWLALTQAERIEAKLPLTQKDFGASIAISGPTLSRWKSEPGFQGEFARLLRARCQRHAPAIIDKMNEKALAGEGDVPAARTVLEHAMPDEKPGTAVAVQVNVSNAELVAGADEDAPLPEWAKKKEQPPGGDISPEDSEYLQA